jgi:aldose 1-epimerase
MNLFVSALSSLPLLAGSALVGHAQAVTEIGGQKVVTLTRAAVSTTKPEFTSITLAPGRGMEIIQITANFPGKGRSECAGLARSGRGSRRCSDDGGRLVRQSGYRLGAAFLAPYPNRIRGKLSADGKTLTTEWQGHTLTLPANNVGKSAHRPSATPCTG